MQAGSSYQTPLRRARGLGAAKTGLSSFIAERVSGVALAPLSLWAIWAVLTHARDGYEGAVRLLSSPVHATLAVLMIGVSFQHMRLGMKVILEDYIQKTSSKFALMLLNTAVCVLGAAVAIVSILKVAFAAA